MAVKIIAEAGSNHDRSLGLAEKMVWQAKDAGADYVKFQFWSSATRLAERRKSGSGYRKIYEKYQIDPLWLERLAEIAAGTGIGLMATCYLPEDIPTVAPFVEHYKVASFEAADLDFIRAHYPLLRGQQRLIVSTGLQQVDTMTALRKERTANPAIALLHCVSAYPAPLGNLNLQQIRTEKLDGFSDHAASEFIYSGALAVALGAAIIEVHFKCLDTHPKNPDAAHALTPRGLRKYISLVRDAEDALGEQWRGTTQNPAEDAMRQYRVAPGQI